jgi:hypothetical protein
MNPLDSAETKNNIKLLIIALRLNVVFCSEVHSPVEMVFHLGVRHINRLAAL